MKRVYRRAQAQRVSAAQCRCASQSVAAERSARRSRTCAASTATSVASALTLRAGRQHRRRVSIAPKATPGLQTRAQRAHASGQRQRTHPPKSVNAAGRPSSADQARSDRSRSSARAACDAQKSVSALAAPQRPALRCQCTRLLCSRHWRSGQRRRWCCGVARARSRLRHACRELLARLHQASERQATSRVRAAPTPPGAERRTGMAARPVQPRGHRRRSRAAALSWPRAPVQRAGCRASLARPSQHRSRLAAARRGAAAWPRAPRTHARTPFRRLPCRSLRAAASPGCRAARSCARRRCARARAASRCAPGRRDKRRRDGA